MSGANVRLFTDRHGNEWEVTEAGRIVITERIGNQPPDRGAPSITILFRNTESGEERTARINRELEDESDAGLQMALDRSEQR